MVYQDLRKLYFFFLSFFGFFSGDGWLVAADSVGAGLSAKQIHNFT